MKEVVGGTGAFEGATGFIRSHSEVDSGTGSIEPWYQGWVCVWRERSLPPAALPEHFSPKEDTMGVFMVDRDLPGVDETGLAGAQRAAIETSEKFRAEGKPVRYIRSTFVPGEAHCMCLFEAPNAELVREVNETAGLPFTRIVEARDLTP